MALFSSKYLHMEKSLLLGIGTHSTLHILLLLLKLLYSRQLLFSSPLQLLAAKAGLQTDLLVFQVFMLPLLEMFDPHQRSVHFVVLLRFQLLFADSVPLELPAVQAHTPLLLKHTFHHAFGPT